MSSQETVRTFVISLPHDKDRRENLEKQLQKLHIPFSIVEAVNGMSLSQEELETLYDRKKALRLFNRELSKGEIGCALSHMSIYKKIVTENIPYALILEDDAKILDDDLSVTLEKLQKIYAEKSPVVTLLSYVPRYIGNNKVQLDNDHCIYDTYRAACAHGYFITKAAAETLIKHLYPIYVVADKWEYFQERFIPVKALIPYSIGLTPASLASNIDAMGGRSKKVAGHKNHRYYIKRLLNQILFLIKSRPFIQIKYQEKSKLDLS